MSIWYSAYGPDIFGQDGSYEEANYRAERNPNILVDVATTSFHDHIRLAFWNNDSVGTPVRLDVLLSPSAVVLLRNRLNKVIDRNDNQTESHT